MRLGIDHERHRKAARDRRNKYRQNPFVPLIDGRDRCSELDREPCNYCVAERDAINLPLFQLTEERAHLCLRRLRIIRYFIYYVEPAARNALLFVSVRSGFT